MKPIYSFHTQIKTKHLLLPSEEKPCPAYIAPLMGKWGAVGDDVVGGSRGRWRCWLRYCGVGVLQAGAEPWLFLLSCCIL